jgi:hypothetical protein
MNNNNNLISFHNRKYSEASINSYLGSNTILGNKIIQLNFYENFCQQLEEGKNFLNYIYYRIIYIL